MQNFFCLFLRTVRSQCKEISTYCSLSYCSFLGVNNAAMTFEMSKCSCCCCVCLPGYWYGSRESCTGENSCVDVGKPADDCTARKRRIAISASEAEPWLAAIDHNSTWHWESRPCCPHAAAATAADIQWADVVAAVCWEDNTWRVKRDSNFISWHPVWTAEISGTYVCFRKSYELQWITIIIVQIPMLWCCHYGRAIARVHPVHLMNVERRQAAANPRPSQTIWAASPPV